MQVGIGGASRETHHWFESRPLAPATVAAGAESPTGRRATPDHALALVDGTGKAMPGLAERYASSLDA